MLKIILEKYQKKTGAYECLALISLDSVIQTNKKYYPQKFLEECKYKLTNKKKNILSLVVLIQVVNLTIIYDKKIIF